MKGASGGDIYTANLTADDETGIGRWTEAEFVRALKVGMRPDGRVLHSPMSPRVDLDDHEAGAIYAYLRTVPRIRNAVPRPAAPAPAALADAHPGKAEYDRYGCASCHGATDAGRSRTSGA